ncbi:sugar transferase [Gemella cuniculi]|uniref:sugar transferase n=1 Tax=Gemella cuniculi TaxID=150240 RepID=UPI000421D188|nr:sugar transferase [Gemella cuniculi]
MEKNILEEKYQSIQARDFYLFFKRTSDIVISLLGIIVLIPITIILIVLFSFGKNKGKLFFYQERIGKNGKKFKIIKFRSMVENAEEILRADKELYEKYVKNSYKLLPEEDPRMTKLGSFLRKTSIDELPQFVNILKGEMSFIGPRPVVEEELKEYGSKVDKFLSIKPGATGWWQVKGRSSIKYPERCDLELYYVDNCSIKLDVKIFFMEIKRMFTRDSAY